MVKLSQLSICAVVYCDQESWLQCSYNEFIRAVKWAIDLGRNLIMPELSNKKMLGDANT